MKTKATLSLWVAGILLVTAEAGLGQPRITQQPQNLTNIVGTTATFTVAAIGIPPLTNQWQQNTAGIWTDLPDCTNTDLCLNNVQTSHDSDYRVVVGDATGITNSEAAHLFVIVPPVITRQPINWPILSLGAKVSNSVAASGPLPPAYQWRLNSIPIPGQTKSSIIISNLQLSDLGDYDVVVTNIAGAVTSTVAPLTGDTKFTKITTGPLAKDLGDTWGASWGDYDGDGYVDLFVARHAGKTLLYNNNGDGTFTTFTNLPSRTSSDSWGGGAWADLDNDGSLDLFAVRNDKTGFYYFNNGDGSFTERPSPILSPFSISMADYDRDGLLDVLIPRYPAGLPVLLHNNGDRTFTSMTKSQAGALVTTLTFGNAAWADYDDDGWLEVYLANADANRSYIFRNDGTGKFTPVTNLVTRTVQQQAYVGAWGDYDNDGRLDLCVGQAGGSSSLVYHNLGNGEFEKANLGVTLPAALGPTAAWVDYDNDGFLDLFMTFYDAFPRLYHNTGDGTFAEVKAGSVTSDAGNNDFGAVLFDYDNDGFLDLAVFRGSGEGTASLPNFLYRNNGNSNAWLVIKPVGTKSNRSGIGAKVRVQATYRGQSRWQRRDITAGNCDSATTQQLYAYFGLGDATIIESMRIEWPSGTVEEFTNIAPRQILTIVEPSLRGAFGDGGQFQLNITGNTNQNYRVDWSNDLVVWTPLTNIIGTGTATPVKIVDPFVPTPNSARFYRMK